MQLAGISGWCWPQTMDDSIRTTLADLRFAIEVPPFVEGDMTAARWIGTGALPDGRFVEYWTGTSES